MPLYLVPHLPLTHFVCVFFFWHFDQFAGMHTLAHIEAFVDDVVLVSESDLIEAARACFESGLVVEASGAAAVAALRSGAVRSEDYRSVVGVVSGRNVTLDDLAELLA